MVLNFAKCPGEMIGLWIPACAGIFGKIGSVSKSVASSSGLTRGSNPGFFFWVIDCTVEPCNDEVLMGKMYEIADPCGLVPAYAGKREQ